MKSQPSGQQSFADTQALWRFAKNPRVQPVDLAVPLLAVARQGLANDCDGYALAIHDWSRLDFLSHTRKTDRLRMTHVRDVGYELQSTVLVSDRDGTPICAPVQSLATASGVLSSCTPHEMPHRKHLDELNERIAWLQAQHLGRPQVHIVDREADSVAHLRHWSALGALWLVRVKGGSRVRWEGHSVKLSELATYLPFEQTRQVDYKGRPAVQWLASAPVVVSRAARPAGLDKQGKRLRAVPGAPLAARLVVSQVCSASGELLAEWYLLSNAPEEVDAPTLALWYYWRWRIESYFKLLKEAGQQLESWGQQSGSALFKRLLIASQACALAWRLMRAEGDFARQTRHFLVRLSGRQMKRGKPVTASALLAGLNALFTMTETLQQYTPTELAAFAREARGESRTHGPPRAKDV